MKTLVHSTITSTMSPPLRLFDQRSLIPADYTVDLVNSASVVAVPAVVAREVPNHLSHQYPRTAEEWKQHFDSFEKNRHNIPLLRKKMLESLDRDEEKRWTRFEDRPRVEIVKDSANLFMVPTTEDDKSPYIAFDNVFGHHEGTETELFAMLQAARRNLMQQVLTNQEMFPNRDDPRHLNVRVFNCANIEQIASATAEELQLIPIVYSRILLSMIADCVSHNNSLPDNDRNSGIGMLCQTNLEFVYFCIVMIYSTETRATICERYSIPCKREFEFVRNLIKDPETTLQSLLVPRTNSAPVGNETKLYMLKEQSLPVCPGSDFTHNKTIKWANDCCYDKTLLLSIVEIYLYWSIAFTEDLAKHGKSHWFDDPIIAKRVREYFRYPENAQRFIAYTAPRLGYISQYTVSIFWLLETYSNWHPSEEVSPEWQPVRDVLSEFIRYNYSPTLYKNIPACFVADTQRCWVSFRMRSGIDIREVANEYEAFASCHTLIRFWVLSSPHSLLRVGNEDKIEKIVTRMRKCAVTSLLAFADANIPYLNKYTVPR